MRRSGQFAHKTATNCKVVKQKVYLFKSVEHTLAAPEASNTQVSSMYKHAIASVTYNFFTKVQYVFCVTLHLTQIAEAICSSDRNSWIVLQGVNSRCFELNTNKKFVLDTHGIFFFFGGGGGSTFPVRISIKESDGIEIWKA